MAGDAKSDRSFNLSRWAIEHPSVTRFLLGIVVIAGVLGLMNIGQKEDPDFTFRVMVVQVVWPGASLTEMQDQVVNKIERKLQETPHLDFVRSFTRPGSAIITVQIKGDTFGRDVTDAFYQVRKKVGDIASELPSGIYGPYFNDEFGDTFITLHAITGDGYSFPELKSFATAARDVLLRVPGVEKVVILGDQPEKLYIDVSSKVLAERGISVLDIQNALAGQNNVAAAGRVETSARSVRVTVGGDIARPEDLGELRLKLGGQVVRLGDIATVTRGLEDPFTRKYRFNGKDAVEVGVVMGPGFNVTTVGKDVHKALADFEATLPEGVEVGQISDQPEVVTDAIDEFAEALIEALAIVLIVSFISIGWRAGLVVAITIPLVLAATFALMYEFGIDLQRISLGALIIALGLLVDDAMIAVEMMERKLQEGLARLDAASFAYRSTAFPMLTGTLITVAGFIPVGFAASTAGEYVRTLFYVVGIALIVSWFAAVYLHALARPHAAPGAQARGRAATATSTIRASTAGSARRSPGACAGAGWCSRRRSSPSPALSSPSSSFRRISSRSPRGRRSWSICGCRKEPAPPRSRRRPRPSRPRYCPIPTSASSQPISAKGRRASSCRSTSSSATRISRSSWSSPRTSRRASG